MVLIMSSMVLKFLRLTIFRHVMEKKLFQALKPNVQRWTACGMTDRFTQK